MVRWMRMPPLKLNVIHLPLLDTVAGYAKDEVDRRIRRIAMLLRPEAGISHDDIDHLMIYDAPCSLPGASFARLPIYGLEGLGLVPRGEAGRLHCRAQPAPVANCRSTPMAAAFRTCMLACTACRRACDRCAAPPLPRSPAPRFRSATASAACSPPPARSSCRMRDLRPSPRLRSSALASRAR